MYMYVNIYTNTYVHTIHIYISGKGLTQQQPGWPMRADCREILRWVVVVVVVVVVEVAVFSLIVVIVEIVVVVVVVVAVVRVKPSLTLSRRPTSATDANRSSLNPAVRS